MARTKEAQRTGGNKKVFNRLAKKVGAKKARAIAAKFRKNANRRKKKR